ncbi:protein-export chaperone SecB [Dyadobacter chenhuakuii]|uniref:Protein-export chaperone SecB n=1 Tax=Dyadobacter chenhuakuii TaxID=2909339 RepID=A0ABY4XJ24_9BACT|nr:protein-export chaperone SecB [Dyadobacter chenhuakuii]MCF2496124.1 protein-export chaperone SecB [Dyadobacter chenhuakuii]USJ30188.1 protein-export chaperone SecB [Dyadobacter chenhuakuii]
MAPKIVLKLFQITNLSLESKTVEENVTDDLEANLRYGVAFPTDSHHDFAIKFNVFFGAPDKDIEIKVEATAHFQTDSIIDDEFKESTFITINAPAIAFPYLRAFISNLTLNSGYRPLILPSFNFMALADLRQKEDISNNAE